MVGYIPQYTEGTSTAGVCMLSFGSIPVGAVISSATLVVKSVRYSGASTHTVKLRISSSYQAFSTSEPSGYQSASVLFNTTLADRAVDITAQMQTYAVAGSAFYLYAYETNPSNADFNTDHFQGIAASTPYIDIEYTVGGDTVGHYNGSTFENCEAYLYDGSGFVLCEGYCYDEAEWKQCSTT